MLARATFGLMCAFFVSVMEAQAARITASTMDSNGNVYVTGWMQVTGGWGVVTIKYDKIGNMLWSHSFPNDPAVPDSEGWGIAVDPSGNVYVAGHSGASTNVDCLLIKYPAGYSQGQSPEWVRTYSGGYGHDQNWTIAIDSQGFIYVTGYSMQRYDSRTTSDIITMKYDGEGNMVWGTPALYNGPANRREHAFAIVVDPITKNVYVTGTSQRDTLASTNSDLITIKYDSNGTQQWVKRYSGPVNGYNVGTSLALDAQGNVYVTGYSQGISGPSATDKFDFVTLKYDVDGNEMWVARYDGPAAKNDQAAPHVGGSLGGAVATYIQNNQGIIVTTEVLDPAPEVQYLTGLVSGLNVNRGIKNSLQAKLNSCMVSLLAKNAAARKNAHNVLAAFVNELLGLAAEGVIANEKAGELIRVANQIIKGILGIETTVVYVVGQSEGVGTDVDFALIKYNAADGSPMWNLPGQPGSTAGDSGIPPNIALRYDGPANSIDRGWAMAIDLDGNIYVTGPSSVTTGFDYFTIKYFVNTYQPSVLGEGRYNGPGDDLDASCGFATWREPASGRLYIFRDPATSEDYVCVTGNSARSAGNPPPIDWDYAAVMYNGGLSEIWVRRYHIKDHP